MDICDCICFFLGEILIGLNDEGAKGRERSVEAFKFSVA